ncbi:MAG: transketolase C-terminal domain-containing protein [Mediterraneibacter gnavus]
MAKYEVKQMPEDYHFELGKATVIREGEDVTLIGSGIMVSRCKEAAEILRGRGISAEVINVSTIKPLDTETIIRSASKTKTRSYCGKQYGHRRSGRGSGGSLK